MITTRDLQNVVEQVNSKFEDLFKKIAQLEKDLESAKNKPNKEKRPKTS